MRYQKGSVIFSKSRQAWLGRDREDLIRPDGKAIRTRPQVVLGTKKELPAQRIAARKFDEILSRINDRAYRPTRVATTAEFAIRWTEEFRRLSSRITLHALQRALAHVFLLLTMTGRARERRLGYSRETLTSIICAFTSAAPSAT